MNHTPEAVLAVLPELDLIGDPALREAAVAVWCRAWEISGAAALEQALVLFPGIADAATGVLHVRSMIRLAVEAATTMRDVYGIPIDVDVAAVGAALHDVGKLIEFAPSAGGTPRGPLLHHAVTGAGLALEAGLPPEIVHIIAYHSRFGEGVDRSLECRLVTGLDDASVDGLVRRASGLSLQQYVRMHPV